MLFIAAFYLQRRRMTLMEYLGWGLLAVLLPALGPFLVILSAPGQPRIAHGRSMRWRGMRKIRKLYEASRLKSFSSRTHKTINLFFFEE
jgi:hypothetical protein